MFRVQNENSVEVLDSRLKLGQGRTPMAAKRRAAGTFLGPGLKVQFAHLPEKL
jgi:hypothetical protein